MQRMWDEKYGTDEYFYGTEANEYFKDKLKSIKPGKLFLPGEGEGRNACFAASLDWDVLACDQSTEGQSKAIKLATIKKVKIRYYLSDLETEPIADSGFDAAGIIFFHLPPNIQQVVFSRISDALKPGGFVIIEVFSPGQLEHASGGPKAIDMLYTTQKIKDLFPGFRFIELHEMSVNLDEGKGHSGKAMVVRGFLQKL